MNLFAIQFNQYNRDQNVFATAGSNRVSIYEYTNSGKTQLISLYAVSTLLGS